MSTATSNPITVVASSSTDGTLVPSTPTDIVDKEVAMPRSDSDKETAAPTTNTDKQVFSRTEDSSKEVTRSLEHNGNAADADTAKQVVPKLPPVSMEKEVAAPTNNEDKEIVTSSSLGLSRTESVLSRSNAFLSLRVEKYNPYGLILPQDQKLSLRGTDPRTNADLGPMYMTGEMSWIDVMSVLPPMFELFRYVDSGATVRGGLGLGVMPGAVMVARSVPKGWEGVSGIKVDIECSTSTNYTTETEVGREKWVVERRGLGRNYNLRRETGRVEYVWKGTSSAVKEMVNESVMEGGKKERVHKGNLKLVGKFNGGVMAVWQQARDTDVLGNLTIFNEARGKLSTEVIVTTCLTAVSAERASGANWLGGFGR